VFKGAGRQHLHDNICTSIPDFFATACQVAAAGMRFYEN
jgi:hypothetical protein